MQRALFWEQANRDRIRCLLCPHHCLIEAGNRGRCGVRENRGGQLVALNYGWVSAIALDPVEKKPLYHFCPGHLVLSVGSKGCNLNCGYCQNWAAVAGGEGRYISPGELVDLAAATVDRNNCGLAWTYTEPLMWFEYVFDTASLARDRGLKTVLVTNGYLDACPWQELIPLLDAVNIDLKAFRSPFYHKYCQGSLQPVLDNIGTAVGSCHVEVTTLLIEGLNTSTAEIDDLAAFLADLDANIPLHLSRYYPARQWRRPATDPALIRRLAERARRRLNFVYTGNLPDSYSALTLCPRCGHCLIKRGWEVRVNLSQGRCPNCNAKVNILLCDRSDRHE